ncbi:MAG: hypothetical protein PVJ92_00810 [Candidatus Dependentiae bacterium]|jgi:hypothetical protein
MITFQKFSRFSLCCALLIMANGQLLFSSDDRPHFGGMYPYGMGGYNSAGRNRSKRLAEVRAHLDSLHSRRGALENNRDNWTGRMEEYSLRLAELNDSITQYEQRFNDASKNAGSIVGTAWARGFAGKDAWSMLDLEAEDPLTGAGAGLSYRVANLIGTKLEETLDKEGSEMWHSVVGGMLRSFSGFVLAIWYKLFHGGYRPLNVTDLSDWGRLVDEVILQELDKKAKDSVQLANSSKSDRFGSFLDMGEDGAELPSPEEFAQQQEDRVWRLKVQGYAQDLSDLIDNFEFHKPYYLSSAKGANTQTNIVRHIVRLQDDLKLLRDEILLPSRSLKELASGDTKLFLPQLSKDLKKRFELLGAIVGRYHGGYSKDKNATPAAPTQPRHGAYGYGNM